MGDEVHPYETPKEVGGKLEEVRELVQAYNDVRYGQESLKE